MNKITVNQFIRVAEIYFRRKFTSFYHRNKLLVRYDEFSKLLGHCQKRMKPLISLIKLRNKQANFIIFHVGRHCRKILIIQIKGNR